jgi:predicted dinucleotide-utilizing enzyme
MFSKILHRPVFAIVLSLVFLFVGALAIKQLPDFTIFLKIAPHYGEYFYCLSGIQCGCIDSINSYHVGKIPSTVLRVCGT